MVRLAFASLTACNTPHPPQAVPLPPLGKATVTLPSRVAIAYSKVQLLLRRDMKFLDDIQLQMSTAREFMFCYRIPKTGNDQTFAMLNRLEKQINDQGFDCKRAGKDDIKRFLSRYFGHMCEDSIDDVDGERLIRKWIIPD